MRKFKLLLKDENVCSLMQKGPEVSERLAHCLKKNECTYMQGKELGYQVHYYKNCNKCMTQTKMGFQGIKPCAALGSYWKSVYNSIK